MHFAPLTECPPSSCNATCDLVPVTALGLGAGHVVSAQRGSPAQDHRPGLGPWPWGSRRSASFGIMDIRSDRPVQPDPWPVAADALLPCMGAVLQGARRARSTLT